MRLRVDELELPGGTVIADYYVRESHGFVIAFAVTPDERIVLVRQYRYGSDAIHLEVPAGTLGEGEDVLDCARRELREETGYEAAHWEYVGSYFPEPARATSLARIFLATGARCVTHPQLDPTEVLEVELATFDEFRAMLAEGTVDAGLAIVAGYRCLDKLGKL